MELNKKQVGISKLSNTKTALQLLAAVGLAFLLFSQLSVTLRKNFSVQTYPIATYSLTKANQTIGEILSDTTVETREKTFLLSQRLLDSGSLIAPKYLANFGDADGWELIKKNFKLYFNGGYELDPASAGEQSSTELAWIINDISNQARRFWPALRKVFIGSSPINLDDWKDYFRVAVHPLVTMNGNSLATQNCLVKNNKKEWSVSSAGICARKGYFLALRAFLLETLDKEIAFPLKLKGKVMQLKKFKAEWGFTDGYIELQNYLEKTKIINIFHQNPDKFESPIDKLNDGLKALATYEMSFKDVFTLYDQSKELPYQDLTLSAIGFQFSDSLPLFVRLQSWIVVKNEQDLNNKTETWTDKKDEKTTTETTAKKDTKTDTKKDTKASDEAPKKLDYVLSDNGVMVAEIGENEKNNLNFEIMNNLFNSLKAPTLAYYKDIFFSGNYAKINHDNTQVDGCALTLPDASIVSYPIAECDDIRNILGLSVTKTNSNKTTNIVAQWIDRAFTQTNTVNTVRGIDFNVPAWGILGVNKQWVWFWIKGLEQEKNTVKLVVKLFSFNFSWPSFDESNVDNQNMMQAWSFVVQILYFLLYFTLYYVFLSLLSLGITALYNYRLNLKHWGGGLDENM